MGDGRWSVAGGLWLQLFLSPIAYSPVTRRPQTTARSQPPNRHLLRSSNIGVGSMKT